MPFRYLIGLPLGSWIMRKAIEPSVEVAGKVLRGRGRGTGADCPTRIGAMWDTRERYGLSRTWGARRGSQVNKGGPLEEEPSGPTPGQALLADWHSSSAMIISDLADRGKVASNDMQRRMFLRSGSVGGHRRTRGYGLLSLPFMPFLVGSTGQRLLALEA